MLKGASSVLYGQLSPGGLINAVSKRPTDTALHWVSADVANPGVAGTFDPIEGEQYEVGIRYQPPGLSSGCVRPAAGQGRRGRVVHRYHTHHTYRH